MIDRMSIVSGFISKWGMRIYPKQSEQVIFLNGEHDDFPLVWGILDVQNVQPVQPRQTLQEFHSSVCSEHGSLMIAMDLQE